MGQNTLGYIWTDPPKNTNENLLFLVNKMTRSLLLQVKLDPGTQMIWLRLVLSPGHDSAFLCADFIFKQGPSLGKPQLLRVAPDFYLSTLVESEPLPRLMQFCGYSLHLHSN